MAERVVDKAIKIIKQNRRQNKKTALLSRVCSAENISVSWTSPDTSVATVENGVVTAHQVGFATIKATTTDGSDIFASCNVNF